MSGLLLKDFYTLKKNSLYMIVMVAVFAVVPVYFLNLFASGYAALLMINAMGYDERVKWDRLAVALPYGRRTIVLSRYVMGLICIASTAMLTLLSTFIRSMITGAEFQVLELAGLSTAGLCFQALVLPFMFKLGVEKGRMAYLAGVMLMVGSVTALNAISPDVDLVSVVIRAQGAVLLLGALALNALSAWLSVRFYRNQAL